MKTIIICIIILFSLSTGIVTAQVPATGMPLTLEKLFNRLSTVPDDSSRLRINDSIKAIIEEYVASDRIFKDTFHNLRYLGQISSPDSSIKIITWNLVLSDQPGKYFCYFIRRSPRGQPNKIFSLKSSYKKEEILTDTVYSSSEWYGALYYDIRPFLKGNGKQWILLGINYSNPQMTRKIIDVLSFTTDDNLIFGKKVFESGGKLSYRHVLEYSARATITLRFQSDKTIVFDHLVPVPPTGNDERIYNGPDYSYDEFVLKKDLWHLEINIDVRNKRK